MKTIYVADEATAEKVDHYLRQMQMNILNTKISPPEQLFDVDVDWDEVPEEDEEKPARCQWCLEQGLYQNEICPHIGMG